MPRKYWRETLYGAFIGIKVPTAIKDGIVSIADAEDAPEATITREVLSAGLSLVKERSRKRVRNRASAE